jgi:predicted transcriptional regulator
MPSPPHTSSILVQRAVKERLDSLKLHPRETYNEIIVRLIDCSEESEPLSTSTIDALEKGLKDLKEGKVFPRDEVMHRLGVE